MVRNYLRDSRFVDRGGRQPCSSSRSPAGGQNELRFILMVLTKKLKNGDPIVHINDEQISLIGEIRFLDLTLNRKLTFAKVRSSHVAKACVKATNIYRGLARVAKVTWGMSPVVVRAIFVEMIEPVLYASCAWASAIGKLGVRNIRDAVQRSVALKASRVHLPSFRADPPETASSQHKNERSGLSGRTSTLTEVEGKIGEWHDGEGIWYSTLRLDPLCTAFQAEMVALQRAIRKAENGKYGLVNIFSDFRCFLELLTDPKIYHLLTHEARREISEIVAEGKAVRLFWVRVHAGIVGNELTRLAALTKKTAAVYDRFPLSHAKVIRAATLEEWQKRDAEGSTGQITKCFFPLLFRSKLRDSLYCACDPAKIQDMLDVLEDCDIFHQERVALETGINVRIARRHFPEIIEYTDSKEVKYVPQVQGVKDELGDNNAFNLPSQQYYVDASTSFISVSELIQQYKGSTECGSNEILTKNDLSSTEGSIQTKMATPEMRSIYLIEENSMVELKTNETNKYSDVSDLIENQESSVNDNADIVKEKVCVTENIKGDAIREEEVKFLNFNKHKCPRFKTNLTLEDLQQKLKLGKTGNGKRLIAKMMSIHHNNSTAYKCNERSGKDAITPSCNSAIYINSGTPKDCPDLEAILELVEQKFMPNADNTGWCSAEDVSATEEIITKLLHVPSSRDMLLGQNVVFTKMAVNISNTLAEGGVETRLRPVVISGRVGQFTSNGGWHFVYLPHMIPNLLKNKIIDVDEFEMSANGLPLPRDHVPKDGCFLHIHINKEHTPTHAVVTIVKRHLPLKLRNESNTTIHVCNTCTAVFRDTEQFNLHHKSCFKKHENLMNLDQTNSNSETSTCDDMVDLEGLTLSDPSFFSPALLFYTIATLS
ncbi:hypothetical protein EVAR_95716_1 [Eumeta japonica]|uniref:Uncharacterized protein n=1 Tax=Eumeta variegata TaxID=151549 RepID=A0A4C1UL88_EUMVA|nr:hypothetical protein EVAR_95716_1 [Eumeta japonica]